MRARVAAFADRRGPAVAAGAAALSVLCMVGAIALWAYVDPRLAVRAPLPGDVVLGTAWPVAGALVVRAAPRNAVGWILTSAGLLGPYYLASYYAAWATLPGVGVPAADAAAWLGHWGFVPYFFVLPLVLLLFPEGRPLTPRWRIVVVATAAVAAVTMLARMVLPGELDQAPTVLNPVGVGPEWLAAVTLVGSVLCIFGGNALGVVALLLRTRRAVGVQRAQLQWLLLGGIVLLVGFALPIGSDAVREVALAVGLLGPPLAIVIAIWRHRLFDVEFALNRTLVLVTLSTVLVAAYAGGLVVLHRLGLTAGSIGVVVVAVAALAAASLRPVVQRGVDRLLFGHRGDAYAVVARVGRHLAPASEPEEALQLLVEALRRSLRLPYVAFVDPTGERALASSGAATAGWTSVPASALGDHVGDLRVGTRRRDERLGAEERAAIEEVAARAGTLAYAARLVADVADSRSRIVAAREEERRRLRDDLHDELGPTLAGSAHQLDALARRLRAAGDAEGADRAVALRDRMRGTVAEVRHIVHGLRPPVLDQGGLAGALALLVDGIEMPRCDVRVSLPTRLPAAIEVTAYAIAAEAVNNALRHSAGSRLAVRARVDGDTLRLEVSDNGQGVPARRGGVGLRSMAERAAEVGGRLDLLPAPGGGTLVRALLPVADDVGGGG